MQSKRMTINPISSVEQINKLKISIVYEPVSNAWGGGNQFLKALKKQFSLDGCYENSIRDADVLIFNSHHNLNEMLRLRIKYPNKIFIHRIDGPIVNYRGGSNVLDLLIYKFNSFISHGTVFQSRYSKNSSFNLGMKHPLHMSTIFNAPDPNLFNKRGKCEFLLNRKTKIIAVSWSANIRKGFDVYKWIDNNLDFSRFDFVFVGNSPIHFNNIQQIKPLNSQDLAVLLKNSDIYITASQKDPCSNSLIEALHCGLPSIVLEDGGHPEIVNNKHCTFNGVEGLLGVIDDVVNNYHHYQKQIELPSMQDVAKLYYNFSEHVFRSCKTPSSLDILKVMQIRLYLFFYRSKYLISSLRQKIFNKIGL
jgi:glycosyltransferase involved in cell wall biosynthesis